MKKLLLSCLLLLATVTAAQADDSKVMLRMTADKTAAVPNSTLQIAIEQVVTEGWHTYWINPGDSGEAMKIKWDLPEGYKAGELLWPAPDRIPYGPLMNFGYHEGATVLTDITIPASATIGDTLIIKGRANVLVCDEICIPEIHDIQLELPIAATATDANKDIFESASADIPQVVDWPTLTEVDSSEVRLRITLPEGQNIQMPSDIVWFPYEWGYIENSTDQEARYEASTRTLSLSQGRSDGRDISAIKEAAYLVKLEGRSVIVNGTLKTFTPQTMGAPKTMPETSASLPMILLFAFIGGLILNLMPCVFPILSMKALHLVSLPSHQRNHAQTSGIFYALGVISMFVALGAVLYAIRAGGEHLGWGFQLQNPAVVAGLAWLLFVIGLNLAGVFDLHVAFGGEILLAEKHHPIVASFTTGVLATLVATPCSAPFMATALGAALVQPMPISLSIFAMVGVGLAFPYVLLCFVPVLQKILPKPGAWMETFKQVLAFPMFASAVWLVWVVAQQGGPAAVGITLFGMVALAFAIWLIDRQPITKTGQRLVTLSGAVLILATLASLAFVVPSNLAAPEQNAEAYYKPFTVDAFQQALTQSPNPVFVNMTASWCITCLVNEKTTLDTPDVKSHFSAMNVTYFKGDWTNRDPDITDFLGGYGRSGVPIYVYYGAPDTATGNRPEPVVLPQILTPDIVLQTIK